MTTLFVPVNRKKINRRNVVIHCIRNICAVVLWFEKSQVCAPCKCERDKFAKNVNRSKCTRDFSSSKSNRNGADDNNGGGTKKS